MVCVCDSTNRAYAQFSIKPKPGERTEKDLGGSGVDRPRKMDVTGETGLVRLGLGLRNANNPDEIAVTVAHRLIGDCADKFSAIFSAKFERSGPGFSLLQFFHNVGRLGQF